MSSISNFTNSKDILSKSVIDSNAGVCTGGNKAVYRIVGSQAGSTTVAHLSVFPLKAPCSYMIKRSIVSSSTDGTSSVSINYDVSIVSQITSGAAILPVVTTQLLTGGGGALGYNAGVGSNVPLLITSYVKNVSNDTINMTTDTTIGTQGRPCNYVIEVEIFNSTNF